jgi:putative YhbY family RNA-binding protein
MCHAPYNSSMKTTLSPTERRALRADAHALDPVVMIGNDGLTPAVIKEIERALIAHELVKIRVLGDDRKAREAFHEEICDKLSAAPVQHIGKILVVWRLNAEKRAAEAKAAKTLANKPKPPRRTKREEQSGHRIRTANKKPAVPNTRRRLVRVK